MDREVELGVSELQGDLADAESTTTFSPLQCELARRLESALAAVRGGGEGSRRLLAPAVCVTPGSGGLLPPSWRRRPAPRRRAPAARWLAAGLVLGVLVTSAAVAVLFAAASSHPCPASSPPPIPLWYTNIYQLFPASFQDTDGDGFGDFEGLIRRLEYIRGLGCTAIRLGSIFSALDFPLEYPHVIDHRNVDPHLGRLPAFDRLVSAAHGHGLAVIIDLDPSSTSDQHVWAAHWLVDPWGPYRHFYLANASDMDPVVPEEPVTTVEPLEPPSRMFGGQLALNLSHVEVQRGLGDVMGFWAARRVDAVALVNLGRTRLRNVAELQRVVSGWRRPGLALMAELPPSLEPALADLLDVRLALLPTDWPSRVLTAPQTAVPTAWYLGSPATRRLADRTTHPPWELLAFLPGGLSWLYGDEIGLKAARDPANGMEYRLGELAPMQWNQGPHAGFCNVTAVPWLPVAPDAAQRNVATEPEPLARVRRMLRARRRCGLPVRLTVQLGTPTALRSCRSIVLIAPADRPAPLGQSYGGTVRLALPARPPGPPPPRLQPGDIVLIDT